MGDKPQISRIHTKPSCILAYSLDGTSHSGRSHIGTTLGQAGTNRDLDYSADRKVIRNGASISVGLPRWR